MIISHSLVADSAIRIKRYRVTLYRPLRIDSHVGGNNRLRCNGIASLNGCKPSNECIALTRRCRQFAKRRSMIISHALVTDSAIRIKRYRVALYRPMRINSHVSSNNRLRRYSISAFSGSKPSGKCVALTRRHWQFAHWLTNTNRNRIY